MPKSTKRRIYTIDRNIAAGSLGRGPTTLDLAENHLADAFLEVAPRSERQTASSAEQFRTIVDDVRERNGRRPAGFTSEPVGLVMSSQATLHLLIVKASDATRKFDPGIGASARSVLSHNLRQNLGGWTQYNESDSPLALHDRTGPHQTAAPLSRMNPVALDYRKKLPSGNWCQSDLRSV